VLNTIRDWLVALWAAHPLEIIGYGVAAAGAVFTLRKWRVDQRWRRLEALFARIRSFDETPGARNAGMILESPSRPIPLWDPREPPERLYEDVTWEDARLALLLDERGRPVHLDRKSNSIRDSFEDFFNRMAHIEMYLDTDMLAEEHVRYVVGYWADRLNKAGLDDGLTETLRAYVRKKNKTAVIRLFKRFGCNLEDDLVASDQPADITRPSAGDATDGGLATVS
jgi:hypothetical protein